MDFDNDTIGLNDKMHQDRVCLLSRDSITECPLLQSTKWKRFTWR